MTRSTDDKRLIDDSPDYWVERINLRDWSYCKYCHRDTPQFLFSEGARASEGAVQVLRCCWECGSSLEILLDP